jgi:hypothetical protein
MQAIDARTQYNVSYHDISSFGKLPNLIWAVVAQQMQGTKKKGGTPKSPARCWVMGMLL